MKRVKWTSVIDVPESKYSSEIPKIVKRELMEREVKPLKARYRVSKGVKYDVSPEVVGKPATIKETVIREGEPYKGQIPASFKEVEFDCPVSELQDYGDVKYYRSEYGKIRVAKNAEYYERQR